MARKTPRPPDQARAIARALRQRFITPDLEAAARRGLAKAGLSIAGMTAALRGGPPPSERQSDARPTATAAPPDRGSRLLDLIREREGIVVPPPGNEAPFTAEEEARARAVLDAFKRRARRN